MFYHWTQTPPPAQAIDAHQVVITTIITLIGMAITFFSTWITYRKTMADIASGKRREEIDERSAGAQTVDRLTDAGLKMVQELERQLDACNAKLEDQAQLKVKLNEYQIAVRRAISAGHELMRSLGTGYVSLDDVHRLETILTNLEVVYNNGHGSKSNPKQEGER